MYFGANGWRQLAPLAPEVPRRSTGADHLRPDRGGGRCAGAGRPVVGDIGRDASERDLDSRRGRRAGDLVGRLRRGSPPFPGWHTRVLSLCAGPGVIGEARLGGIVSRIALRGPRLRKDRQRAAGRVSHGLRYFARREGSGLHDNGQRWRIADLAGVPRPAHTTSPDRRAGDQVSFGADGDLVFRSLEGKTNLLVRIKKDGSGRERITTVPILDKFGVSPDGEWVTALSRTWRVRLCLQCPSTVALPRKSVSTLRGGWSSDGRFFYVESIGVRGLSGKDARDSRAGRQIVAGLARFWNRLGCRRG